MKTSITLVGLIIGGLALLALLLMIPSQKVGDAMVEAGEQIITNTVNGAGALLSAKSVHDYWNDEAVHEASLNIHDLLREYNWDLEGLLALFCAVNAGQSTLSTLPKSVRKLNAKERYAALIKGGSFANSNAEALAKMLCNAPCLSLEMKQFIAELIKLSEAGSMRSSFWFSVYWGRTKCAPVD